MLSTFSKCNVNNEIYSLFNLEPPKNLYYNRLVKIFDETDNVAVGSFLLNLPSDTDGPFFVSIVGEVWVYDIEENLYEQFTILYNQQELYKVKFLKIFSKSYNF
jgi:hypothetical protein